MYRLTPRHKPNISALSLEEVCKVQTIKNYSDRNSIANSSAIREIFMRTIKEDLYLKGVESTLSFVFLRKIDTIQI